MHFQTSSGRTIFWKKMTFCFLSRMAALQEEKFCRSLVSIIYFLHIRKFYGNFDSWRARSCIWMALLTGSGAPNILRFLAIIFLKNNSHSVLSSAPIWKLKQSLNSCTYPLSLEHHSWWYNFSAWKWNHVEDVETRVEIPSFQLNLECICWSAQPTEPYHGVLAILHSWPSGGSWKVVPASPGLVGTDLLTWWEVWEALVVIQTEHKKCWGFTQSAF